MDARKECLLWQAVEGSRISSRDIATEERCFVSSISTKKDTLGKRSRTSWGLGFKTLHEYSSSEDMRTRCQIQIKSPDHYAQFPIEPIIFIQRNRFEFWRGNVIKYVCRAGHKDDEIKDLQKAKRYIEMRINELEGKEINE